MSLPTKLYSIFLVFFFFLIFKKERLVCRIEMERNICLRRIWFEELFGVCEVACGEGVLRWEKRTLTHQLQKTNRERFIILRACDWLISSLLLFCMKCKVTKLHKSSLLASFVFVFLCVCGCFFFLNTNISHSLWSEVQIIWFPKDNSIPYQFSLSQKH